MTTTVGRQSLDAARKEAGLSLLDLWFRYIELGGTATAEDLAERLLDGSLDVLQHDVVARAINERLLELGRAATVGYADACRAVTPDGDVVAPRNVLARPTVGVVIPTLNESKNLPYVLRRLPPEVDEVVIVDGHSTDDTVAVALACRPEAKIVLQDGNGKGNALLCGARAITSDITVMMDADGSTQPDEISRFVDALVAGADVAKGTRFLQGGGSADMTLVRKIGNFFLTWIVNLIWGVRYTDLCYGYNAAWTRCVPSFLAECRGFEVETLMNIRAAAKGLRVAEVPSFEEVRRHGTSNLNALRDGTRVLRTIVAEFVRPR